MLKDKRAQFYIIFAVLVIAIIVGLVTTANYAKKVKMPVKFYDLSEDFEAEVTKIIDYGIFSGQQSQIDTLIDTFSEQYLDYAQKKDPNLELIYIFGDENEITVDNYYYDKSIGIVSQKGTNVIPGPGSEATTSKITIHYGEKAFVKEIGEKMRHYAEISESVKEPGKWVQVEIAGIIHNFDLGPNFAFYYIISTSGEEKEIHVVER